MTSVNHKQACASLKNYLNNRNTTTYSYRAMLCSSTDSITKGLHLCNGLDSQYLST